MGSSLGDVEAQGVSSRGCVGGRSGLLWGMCGSRWGPLNGMCRELVGILYVWGQVGVLQKLS